MSRGSPLPSSNGSGQALHRGAAQSGRSEIGNWFELEDRFRSVPIPKADDTVLDGETGEWQAAKKLVRMLLGLTSRQRAVHTRKFGQRAIPGPRSLRLLGHVALDCVEQIKECGLLRAAALLTSLPRHPQPASDLVRDPTAWCDENADLDVPRCDGVETLGQLPGERRRERRLLVRVEVDFSGFVESWESLDERRDVPPQNSAGEPVSEKREERNSLDRRIVRGNAASSQRRLRLAFELRQPFLCSGSVEVGVEKGGRLAFVPRH